MNIFYLPEIHSTDVVLSEEESAHAVKVLRLKENDQVTLVNGKVTCMKLSLRMPIPKNAS